MLMNYLNITYENLFFTPLFKNVNNITPNNMVILDWINNSNRKTYILNWKGNNKNPHEKNNRMMELENAIPLFQLDINFLVITKDITEDEKKILDKYQVKYIGNNIDNCNKSYYDSIEIIKNVDGVISTDTSLVHLSANLDIKTYVLLTVGCEWRWTRDESTNWYPKSILLRQTKQGKWYNVIEQLTDLIN
jgi:hypothetical protein